MRSIPHAWSRCRRWLTALVVVGTVACGVPAQVEPAAPVGAEPPARFSLAAAQAGESTAAAIPGVEPAGGVVAPGASASARVQETQPYQQPMPPDAGRVASNTSAMAHANLSSAACRAQLRRRRLPVKRARAMRGVANAFRLTGRLHGVSFRGPGPKSKHSIMDCRMVLALDAFARVLARHGVVEVFYGNVYRPRARIAGRRKRSQHAYGLAIDLVWFKLRDKTLLRVEEDYNGRLGEPSCGPSAWLAPVTPEGRAVAQHHMRCCPSGCVPSHADTQL